MKLDQRYKIVGTIPQSLIMEALSYIKPEHWLVDKTRNTMDNLTQTESIIIRYFDEYNNSVKEDWDKHIVNKQLQPLYQPIIDKFLTELTKYYNIKNYMCFYAKLCANGVVGKHLDSNDFLEQCHRIHIPLKTNNNVFYMIEDEMYNWTTGNIYEFDNTRIHGVYNNSSEDRIHLMFNIYE